MTLEYNNQQKNGSQKSLFYWFKFPQNTKLPNWGFQKTQTYSTTDFRAESPTERQVL